ncbi:hypothetical protein [Desulfonema limicola]|uniref:hypothetical protein n=1 Tax=Desulfonema limicola TaxID=45656 RepID=UPI001A9A948C|nr:hypothetical protein [Desulfonema limicola]
MINHESSKEEINQDIKLLKKYYANLPECINDIPKSFNTLLWTLLGEISVPNNLGEKEYKSWPVLIFPFAIKYENEIRDFVICNGCYISKIKSIFVDHILYSCLYAGQPWYPSLLEVYYAAFGEKKHRALLLTISQTESGICSVASTARKLQIQLRPYLPTLEISANDKKYPGIIRAFHTPHLGNVDIHKTIFNMENWK